MPAGRGVAYVVVSGPPGSGKTTLARELALQLDLPLFSKDTIKDALMGVLGAADPVASRRLGAAAIAVLVAVATEGRRGVVESVWQRRFAIEELSTLPGPICEVFCRCPEAVARERVRRRANDRDVRHFDLLRLNEDLWSSERAQPVAGPWPIIEVATDGTIDVPALASEIRSLSF